MIDDANLVDLIEAGILSFSEVSRFDDASLTENITNAMLRRDTDNPGINIAEDEDGITIWTDIIVYYGVNIPQLCYDIQTTIKRSLEETTGLTVKAVNIRVEGIDKAEN